MNMIQNWTFDKLHRVALSSYGYGVDIANTYLVNGGKKQ